MQLTKEQRQLAYKTVRDTLCSLMATIKVQAKYDPKDSWLNWNAEEESNKTTEAMAILGDLEFEERGIGTEPMSQLFAALPA